MRRYLFVAVFFMHGQCAAGAYPSREERELRMAESAILMSGMRSASPEIQAVCAKNNELCLATEQRELALALIGARNSSASLKSLAGTLRFSLDGAGGQDQACYILNNGKKIVGLLRSLSPDALVSQCMSEVKEIKRGNTFVAADSKNVCAGKADIVERQQAYLKAIARNDTCADGDF